MIKDFRKTIKFKKINGQFSFFVDILQLPHTVISNSTKLTHPNVDTARFMLGTQNVLKILFTSCLKS